MMQHICRNTLANTRRALLLRLRFLGLLLLLLARLSSQAVAAPQAAPMAPAVPTSQVVAAPLVAATPEPARIAPPAAAIPPLPVVLPLPQASPLGTPAAPTPEVGNATASTLPVVTPSVPPPRELPLVIPSPSAASTAPAPLPSRGPAATVPAASPPAVAPHVSQRGAVVIRTILGLLGLLVLAYIGGHPKVRQVEKMLGVSQVITAGFPFVVLGILTRLPKVGILTDKVLTDLEPLLLLSLGWIGFFVGFRCDAQMLSELPRAIGRMIFGRVAVVFTIIAAASALLFVGTALIGESVLSMTFLRDAIILGTAGALTSHYTPRLLLARGCDEASIAMVKRVARLQELAGIIGLLFVCAYFRPQGGGVSWQLPGTAWLLLTLGLGTVFGIIIYIILLRDPASQVEAMLLLLGSVAFAAGMAATLRLSPVVVCFFVGLLLANFPGDYKERVTETLTRLERPIYLLFLLVVGAHWRLQDWRGWALLAVFVPARFMGNYLGTRLAKVAAHIPLSEAAQNALVVSPLGSLSIAIVINAQLLYPEGGTIQALVTAIVGGAIATEIVVQLATRTAADAGIPDAREDVAPAYNPTLDDTYGDLPALQAPEQEKSPS
jgi:hypothetical protein